MGSAGGDDDPVDGLSSEPLSFARRSIVVADAIDVPAFVARYDSLVDRHDYLAAWNATDETRGWAA